MAMEMKWVCCFLVLWCSVISSSEAAEGWVPVGGGLVRSRQERKQIVSTEYGTISAVDVGGGYHLQFISLDPNSLFLPAILHAEMVFYVHTGSGRLSYMEVDGGDIKEVKLSKGDVYRLKSGTVFFLQSSLEPQRERLRINSIFFNVDGELQGGWVGAYSSIHELFRGFNKRLLQAAFQVSEDVIEEIRNASCETPPIVHAAAGKRELETASFVKSLVEGPNNKKTKKKDTKTFNFFKEDRDVHSCDGWSTMVTSKHLHALKGSDIGVFMVNLSTSAMMGPHWNPIATEIGVVLEGRGMVQVVCSSNLTWPESCNGTGFLVEEGDIFIVPRFHPMAHMSFNNDTFVFMGFSTSNANNHPQFLAGEASVLHVLNKRVLKLAFKVNDTAISRLLAARKGSVILDCVSCAEEELEVWMKEERKRKKEEETQRRQEEEKQRRHDEEEERRREEERHKEEEEEERRQHEEEEETEERRRHEEEEERRREEEGEEKRRRQEEEEREEERRRQEEEEERRRAEEEEERRRRQEKEEREEERRRHEEEEEEETRRQEEEEERGREEEEEERRRCQEKEEREEERRRHEEEEEETRRQEEEEERGREEEEEERRRRQEKEEREEERRRHEEEEEEEEKRTQEEEEERRRGREEQGEEERRREEEEEEEEWRRQEEEEEERRRRQEKEELEEKRRRQQEEEEEERRRQDEEEERRREEEEEERRRRQEKEEREEDRRRQQEEEEEERRRQEEVEDRRQEEERRQRREEQGKEERRHEEEEETERDARRRHHEEGQEETEEEAATREEEERERQWEEHGLTRELGRNVTWS